MNRTTIFFGVVIVCGAIFSTAKFSFAVELSMDSQIVDGYGVSNPNPPKDEREQINAKASEFAMDKPNVKVDENQIRRASNVEKMIPGKN